MQWQVLCAGLHQAPQKGARQARQPLGVPAPLRVVEPLQDSLGTLVSRVGPDLTVEKMVPPRELQFLQGEVAMAALATSAKVTVGHSAIGRWSKQAYLTTPLQTTTAQTQARH